jgi:hypothetical protein
MYTPQDTPDSLRAALPYAPSVSRGPAKEIARMPTSPKAAAAKRRQARTNSGGGVGTGLLLLIGGLVLHGHFSPIKSACDSGPGVLSQAFEPKLHSHCGLDSALAEIGTVAIVLGAIILAGSLLMVVGLMLEAQQELAKSRQSQSAQPKAQDSARSSTKPDTATAIRREP